MVNIPFLGALAGCSARRSARRVASHTSEEQRRNAPGRAAKNGILAFSASLKLFQVVAMLVAAATAVVQTQAFGAAQGPVARRAAGANVMATGEVLNVYKKEKRLLLKHGPIENLRMDAMTMEFGVADRKLLGRVKPGDKIRFAARRVGDDYLVTTLEVMK